MPRSQVRILMIPTKFDSNFLEDTLGLQHFEFVLTVKR